MKRIRHIAGLLLLTAVAACDHATTAPGQAVQASGRESVADATHELGRKVYNFRCYFCHGYSGDAATVAASHLEPRPRNFQAAAAQELDPARIATAVRHGRAGTAMKGFSGILSDAEQDAVSAFVFREFVVGKKANTRYHSAENGWPGHERYRAAFPFATGALAVDTPFEKLSPQEAAGKRMFMGACISCHDRGSPREEGAGFALRSVTYPPFNYTKEHEEGEHHHESTDPDDPYERHEKAPAVAGLVPHEKRGEAIFQKNCAYCHANDGTGRNWIGAFIDPPPADLNRADVRARLTSARLRQVIRDGVPGTSMPAWAPVLTRSDIDAVAAYMSRAFGAGRGAPATAQR